MQCPFMYCPKMVRVSWDLGRVSWVCKVGWCGLFAHPGAILGWSEYFGSYGQAWYNPYSILKISMPFDSVTGHPSISHTKISPAC